jgi:single-stranded-DNA-specific exonuclease
MLVAPWPRDVLRCGEQLDWSIERRATLARSLAGSVGADPRVAPPLAPKIRQPREDVASHLRAQGVDPLLAKLFASRGISDVSEIGNCATLESLDSLQGCREMAAVLSDCVEQSKTVLILADYDCDGATACAILATAFSACGLHHQCLIPDRQRDGYGLTVSVIDNEILRMKRVPDYIITVDNGISSHEGILRAREVGIQVLVTDHHTPPATLPKATLIVNPSQEGCGFASKAIAGCGVAWYVAKGLAEELEARAMPQKIDPLSLLPFVALGTIADVVPLDRNNRALVAEGLRRIRSGECSPGIKALASVAGRNLETLTCADIAFALAPRLNAAGRIEHMSKGVDLLLCQDQDQAQALAEDLDRINKERQRITRSMTAEAERAVLELCASLTRPAADQCSVTVFDPSWHEGVVGIVAGRLKEARNRPTFVLCRAADGSVKGSGRSISALHLKHALDAIAVSRPGILSKYGGHGMAAGVGVDEARITEFANAFEDYCKVTLSPDDLHPTVLHDGPLDEDCLTFSAVKGMGRQVWGSGFESPTFGDTWQVLGSKAVGGDKQHLKLILGKGRIVVDAIAFGAGGLDGSLPASIDCLYEVQIVTFRGNDSVQLVINHLFVAGALASPVSRAKPARTAARSGVRKTPRSARDIASRGPTSRS